MNRHRRIATHLKLLHCNTLQFTATHCNMLQQRAAHRYTVKSQEDFKVNAKDRAMIMIETRLKTKQKQTRIQSWKRVHGRTEWARVALWLYFIKIVLTLQHTATHTLQHTTLQHTATHCNTLRHTARQCCNTVQQHTAHERTEWAQEAPRVDT